MHCSVARAMASAAVLGPLFSCRPTRHYSGTLVSDEFVKALPLQGMSSRVGLVNALQARKAQGCVSGAGVEGTPCSPAARTCAVIARW